MFDAFRAGFARDDDAAPRAGSAATLPAISSLREFFAEFGGGSFGGGVYRVVRPADLGVWQERVSIAFPQFTGVVCFGFDWAGSVFALDPKRSEEGEPGVLLLEPGTGEALMIPANLASFHDKEILTSPDALAAAFYESWRASGGRKPRYEQCVGYKKPLFLGGVDDIENLELSDLDVYWHVMGELIAATRGLPDGTRINRIKME